MYLLYDTIILCQDVRASSCNYKQLAHFCSITVALKRSEFVDIDFCSDLLLYTGVWVSNNSKKAGCTV